MTETTTDAIARMQKVMEPVSKHLNGLHAEQGDKSCIECQRYWLTQERDEMHELWEDERARVLKLEGQRAQALDACDRMMLGQLSPSGIVAEVREALGWQPVAAEEVGANG